jgi:DNA segregation ATPase FtsK/SpoIIIE-like protein
MTQTYLEKHVEELTNRIIILEKMVAYLLYAEPQQKGRRIEIPYPPLKSSEMKRDQSDPGELDPLFDEIWKMVSETGKASTSYIQRRFSLGYNRSAKVMDQLESEGVIGPADASKPREILKPYTTE